MQQILLELLTAIIYSGDKTAYITKFEQMNYAETLCNLLEKLPQHIQDQITAATNKEEEIKKHINSDEYLLELEKVTINALKELIQAMKESLTPLQKEKLSQVTQSYSL